MASFFRTLSKGATVNNFFLKIWKAKVPPRVTSFTWLALRGAILTMDNLRRRKMIVVNACPMCLGPEELGDHLLLNCKAAQRVWKSILSWFGVCYALPTSLLDHLKAWNIAKSFRRGIIMWGSSFYVAIWCIWKARNSRLL